MAQARAVAATPIGVVFLLSFPLWLAAASLAHARTPAPIEYDVGAAPTQMASLSPVRAGALQPARGPLTAYGYGVTAAPASGPTLDLRGAFADAPAVAPHASYVAPALPSYTGAGPLDIRPPAPPASEPVAQAPPVASAPIQPAPGAYLVQIGAFSQKANADGAKARTAALGAVRVDTVERQSGMLYRVRLGPWPSREAAESARASAVGMGFSDARVTQAN